MAYNVSGTATHGNLRGRKISEKVGKGSRRSGRQYYCNDCGYQPRSKFDEDIVDLRDAKPSVVIYCKCCANSHGNEMNALRKEVDKLKAKRQEIRERLGLK